MTNRGDIQAIQQQLEKRIQMDEISDRRDRDSLYMEAAPPIIAVGRLANDLSQLHTASPVRPGGATGNEVGYSGLDALVRKRDAEAASRMPRSAKAWESEQNRPGSWRSGVGSVTPVGQGVSRPVGQGRPLFKQGE